MSSWTRITFDPGDRSVETVADDLRGAVDDPETFERRGTLVWKETGNFDHDRVATLDVAAERALVVWNSDTTNAGKGYLYERHGGRFLLVDAFEGAEGYFGRDVVDHFVREHDLEGVRHGWV